MKKPFIQLISALLVAASTAIASDTIVLKNGDIMTGTIIEQKPNRVYFKSQAFGSVSLRTEDIKEIRIQTEKLGAVDIPEDAMLVAPQLKPDKPATVAKQVEQKPNNQPVIAKKPQSPKKKKRWGGQAGLSLAMREKTQSNQNGVYREDKYEVYRFYGNVNWKGDRNNLRWDWNYTYSEDEDRVRDDKFNLTQKYNHTFKNDNLFASAKTMYQRDYNRRIENEYLQTAELGIKWFDKGSRIQLSTSAGAGYHKYDRLDRSRTTTTSVSQPKFIFDEKLSWKLINSLTLIQKYTHLGNLDEYHFVFSAGLENKLVQDLFLRAEYKIDRDTEVFYDDRGYYDKALLMSLLYKF
jgi:hypothetical protein